MNRFVALGDSFTEGVGDANRHLPNGVRGWADRVADQLARSGEPWEYANLAVRSKRLRHVIADQLAPAVAMRPTLVTVYAGGNDVMDAGTPVSDILADYERLIADLSATGARLAVFTGYDIPLFPALAMFRRRNHAYNDGVRDIAQRHGATLIDYWAFEGFADRRMWSDDRLHLSKPGHRLLAARVLDHLEVAHSVKLPALEPQPVRTIVQRQRERSVWLRDWVIPLAGRKLRGVTLGDHLSPRWPDPVRVPRRGGTRRLARRSARAARDGGDAGTVRGSTTSERSDPGKQIPSVVE